MFTGTQSKRIFLTLIAAATLLGCGRELTECNGPTVDKSQLEGLRLALFASGPKATLLIPNPMEASQNTQAKASDRSLLQFADDLLLPDLLSPTRLENTFLKIRIESPTDDVSQLATPSISNQFSFDVSDVHYSETMAYQSVSNILRYVQALGFGLLQDRPLYVMVRAKDESNPDLVNAYYEHNFFNPQSPRQIKLYGSGDFAPGMDRDMYWHETGHFINESVSYDNGFDRAGEQGAVYTEGSAIHECFSDYIAESLAGKSHIGKWIAPNFSGFSPGQPLRSAVDTNKVLMFSDVSTADGSGVSPERYAVAEWCSRVLWQIRKSFVTEDPSSGSFFSDRMVLSALGELPKDAGFKDLHAAMLKSDQQLHCGLHQRTIENAFSARGFNANAASLSKPLTLNVEPYTTPGESGGLVVLFRIRVANASGEVARNVRISLESNAPNLIVAQPLQGLGDLRPGAELLIGVGTGSLSDAYSPSAVKSNDFKAAAFTLKALSDNGPEVIFQGSVK